MKEHSLVSEALASRARPLKALGVNNVAWTKGDALEVIASLQGREVAVLGGDVYGLVGGHIVPAYANWHCERRQGELLRDYAERSQRAAASFLRAYPATKVEILFAFVLSEEETAGM